MNKLGSKIGAAFAVLAVVLVGAAKCEGPGPSGLILDISGPPLAQTLGCGDGLWYIRVLNNDVANNPQLTPDQKAAKATTACVKPDVAKKYVVNGQYP